MPFIRMTVEEERETRPALCISLSVLPLYLLSVDLVQIKDETARNTMRLAHIQLHGRLAEEFGVGSLTDLVESEHEVEEIVYQYEQEKGEDDSDSIPF